MIRRGILVVLAIVLGLMVATVAYADGTGGGVSTMCSQEWCGPSDG